MLVDPDLSLKRPRSIISSFPWQVLGQILREKGLPRLFSVPYKHPDGPFLYPHPQTPVPLYPSLPHLAVVFSLPTGPLSGEALFVESAILISHTEPSGFFSLVREEERWDRECLELVVSMLDLDQPGQVAPKSVGWKGPKQSALTTFFFCGRGVQI